MTTPRIEELTKKVGKDLGHIVRNPDLYLDQEVAVANVVRQALIQAHTETLKELEGRYEKDFLAWRQSGLTQYTKEKVAEAHQAGRDEAVERVMPFLRAYKQSLDSDWAVNPVQATHLVYRSPEGVLRDQADAIEAKRKMAIALDDTIKVLQNKKSINMTTPHTTENKNTKPPCICGNQGYTFFKENRHFEGCPNYKSDPN